MKDLSKYASLMARAGEDGAVPTALFSSPGRIEICGNHTDHQCGRVIAAAIDLDTIAAACPRKDGLIRVCSEGYEPFSISIDDADFCETHPGTPASITAGLIKAFIGAGYKPGGFDAYVSSSVGVGSGVSSSSSFELLIASIINLFYCGGRVTAEEMAAFSKYAENEYFGKPSGMMDQLACALGGISFIDFKDPDNPYTERLCFDFEEHGYSIFVVDSGANHADMTGLYASIPEEMRAVAGYFGAEHLRQVNENDFYTSLNKLRSLLGDRAVLRTIHFFEENRRVEQMSAALKAGQTDDFLKEVRASGISSWMYLQNVIPPGNTQALAVALAVIDRELKGRGAVRVHGGGFAGTALAFVPGENSASFIESVDEILGNGSCRSVHIRQEGALGFSLTRT